MKKFRFADALKTVAVSDERRKKVLFELLNATLVIISAVMSLVNILSGEIELLLSSGIYGLLCLTNFLLLRFAGAKVFPIYLLFEVESVCLLFYFLLRGTAGGFSVLWICLVPGFSLLIFGIKQGSVSCLVLLCGIVFFFWTSFGRSLLGDVYTEQFLLRFPFLYGSIYLISLVIELVRKETQRQLEQLKGRYHYLYRHDALTGLYNRYGVHGLLEKLNVEEGSQVSVILFDIDDFKQINDHYGHECGDEVLKNIARLCETLPGKNYKCCRWGGEEFLILLPQKENAAAVAEMLRRKIREQEIHFHSQSVRVTVSVGVCAVKKGSDLTVHQAVEEADRALYESKENGKDCVTVRTVGDCRKPETTAP